MEASSPKQTRATTLAAIYRVGTDVSHSFPAKFSFSIGTGLHRSTAVTFSRFLSKPLSGAKPIWTEEERLIINQFFCVRLNVHTTSLGRPASLRAIVVVSLRALMATPVQGETSRRAPTAHETSLRLVISNSMIEASQRFHLPVRWLRAVMRAESDADIGAVSKKGAIGLMQIMPETYAGLGNYPRAASQSARGSGGPATTRSAIASALYGRAA